MGNGVPHRTQRSLQITPRTDAATIEITGKEYVTAAFARQLERELQDALKRPISPAAHDGKSKGE